MPCVCAWYCACVFIFLYLLASSFASGSLMLTLCGVGARRRSKGSKGATCRSSSALSSFYLRILEQNRECNCFPTCHEVKNSCFTSLKISVHTRGTCPCNISLGHVPATFSCVFPCCNFVTAPHWGDKFLQHCHSALEQQKLESRRVCFCMNY